MQLLIVEIVDNKLVSSPLVLSISDIKEAYEYLTKRESRRDWVAIIAGVTDEPLDIDLTSISEEVVATLRSSRKASEILDALNIVDNVLWNETSHVTESYVHYHSRLIGYLERVMNSSLKTNSFVKYYVENKFDKDQIITHIERYLEDEAKRRLEELKEKVSEGKEALETFVQSKADGLIKRFFEKVKLFFNWLRSK